MQTVSISLPQSLPLRHEAEIMVVGGGPGGIGSAVAAAREGRDVLLVEHYGFLGGMATAGEVNPFMPNHVKGESMDKGIFSEWLERTAAYGGARGRVFDPNVARLAAEDLCLDAGVRLLYHHRAAHVETADGRITHLALHSKSGLTAARAQMYVDSTGDGDVAAMAGAKFEVGNGNSGHVQPMTLCFKLKLDPADLPPESRERGALNALKESYQAIQDAYQAAKADGRIDNPRENVLMFSSVDKDVVHFNTTRVIHRLAIDGEQFSAAEIEGRRQLRQLIDVLRADVPIFRNATVYSIAPQIGVRESRRIIGHVLLTRADYEAGRTFPDGIARVNYPIDIHNPDGTGTEIVHLPKGAWYEVPYGCLVPVGLKNLLIGSRCISADHATHSSLRVMPPVCSIGQAAGTAAAMALDRGCAPSELDGAEVKARLVANGRNLEPYVPDRRWADNEAPEKLAARAEKRATRLNA